MIEKSTEHAGHQTGDTVRIHGEQGMYVWMHHGRNTAGDEWYTLFGGPEGRRQYRTVTCDRVRGLTKREARSVQRMQGAKNERKAG